MNIGTYDFHPFNKIVQDHSHQGLANLSVNRLDYAGEL